MNSAEMMTTCSSRPTKDSIDSLRPLLLESMLAGKTREKTEFKENIMMKKMRHLMKFRKKKQEKKAA
jgi:hypothetical protein